MSIQCATIAGERDEVFQGFSLAVALPQMTLCPTALELSPSCRSLGASSNDTRLIIFQTAGVIGHPIFTRHHSNTSLVAFLICCLISSALLQSSQIPCTTHSGATLTQTAARWLRRNHQTTLLSESRSLLATSLVAVSMNSHSVSFQPRRA